MKYKFGDTVHYYHQDKDGKKSLSVGSVDGYEKDENDNEYIIVKHMRGSRTININLIFRTPNVNAMAEI